MRAPDFIASDMMAQAEHDESASSILVTTSSRLAESSECGIEEVGEDSSQKINNCVSH